MTVEVNDTNFEEKVINSNVPVLVDFWAEWCGPCRMIAPIINELSEQYENEALMTKLDVDTSPETAAKYGIRNIPTILLFKDGKVVDKQVGAVPKSILIKKIDNLL
ncbi:MAG: thioredoxin [Bacteroidetes bacterium]|jgi:thioredoxin 1|nr:thioredoxin [Bacteroidota bacterium]MBT6686158.1 thioredoxin [Bacteroidota bacterium]MBT7143869.1 thioredoxin [Bacteroidota bacterium]MBT7491224.1 thioredoxin [Bacteroidota bacterium]